MTFEELSSPTSVAKWFGTTPNNVRKTYMHPKPKIYKLQCVASYVMESGVTAAELEMALKIAKAMRGVYGRKIKSVKKSLSS